MEENRRERTLISKVHAFVNTKAYTIRKQLIDEHFVRTMLMFEETLRASLSGT